MKKLLLILALLVSPLAACSTVSTVTDIASKPVGVQTIADARNVVYAVKSGYGVALPYMTIYVMQKPCSLAGAPPAPLCSNTDVVRILAKTEQALKSALASAETLVLSTSPDASALTAAISVLQTAYAEFQKAVVTAGIKIGG